MRTCKVVAGSVSRPKGVAHVGDTFETDDREAQRLADLGVVEVVVKQGRAKKSLSVEPEAGETASFDGLVKPFALGKGV